MAEIYVRSQGITTRRQFENWPDRPPDIPADPAGVYGRMGQWQGWGAFLDTGNISSRKREWRDVHLAEIYVRSQGITTETQFHEWSAERLRPPDIPAHPDIVYGKMGQWQDWGDFLGTGNISNSKKIYRDFDLAKAYIQALNFKTLDEFKQWSKSGKRPPDIPSRPDQVYGRTGQWTDWGDFLGTGNISNSKKEWRDYRLAGDYVRSQGITTETQFHEWSDAGLRPPDIPAAPHWVYARLGQWKGWGDFLKTGNTNNIEWRDYYLAEAYIRPLGFERREQFRKWSAEGLRPPDIPANPDRVYGRMGQWQGWRIFLGTHEWMNFLKARRHARKLAFESAKDFILWLKSDQRPKNFPLEPHKHYPEWISTADFLGIQQMPFHQAKQYVRQIGFETKEELLQWILSEGESLPENFPVNPSTAYKEWRGWEDFLGHPKKTSSQINGHSLDNAELQSLIINDYESSSLQKYPSDLHGLREDINKNIEGEGEFDINEVNFNQSEEDFAEILDFEEIMEIEELKKATQLKPYLLAE